MAKALFGQVVPVQELQLLAEARRLRSRVADLEVEVVRLRAENDRLAAQMSEDATAVDIVEIVGSARLSGAGLDEAPQEALTHV